MSLGLVRVMGTGVVLMSCVVEVSNILKPSRVLSMCI